MTITETPTDEELDQTASTPADEVPALEHVADCTDEQCTEGCPVAEAMQAAVAQQGNQFNPLMLAQSLLFETAGIAGEKSRKGPAGINFADRIALTQAAASVALAVATSQQVGFMAAQFELQQQQFALLAGQMQPPAGAPVEPSPADALLVPSHVAAAQRAARAK